MGVRAMSKADEYRQRGADCEQVASALAAPDEARLFRTLAKAWRALAARAEDPLPGEPRCFEADPPSKTTRTVRPPIRRPPSAGTPRH
jgi:hypothetical protein